jgi:hypothetical protein
MEEGGLLPLNNQFHAGERVFSYQVILMEKLVLLEQQVVLVKQVKQVKLEILVNHLQV